MIVVLLGILMVIFAIAVIGITVVIVASICACLWGATTGIEMTAQATQKRLQERHAQKVKLAEAAREPAASLLRASHESVTPIDQLVRPATGNASVDPAELLRAQNADGS